MPPPAPGRCLASLAHLCLCAASIPAVTGQDGGGPRFGDRLHVRGMMEPTGHGFPDGFAVHVVSPVNRTMVVSMNPSPLPGHLVGEGSGEGFFSLSPYSWVVQLNEEADDLVAEVRVPCDPDALGQQGVHVADTYVAKLAEDRKSWQVLEEQSNVYAPQSKRRSVAMKSIEGEFMLLGRRAQASSDVFMHYGQGKSRTVRIAGGDGVHRTEYIDGMRIDVQSSQPLSINAEIPFGMEQSMMPPGTVPMTKFAWALNTTGSADNTINATLRLPFSRRIFPEFNTWEPMVARRSLKPNGTERFQLMRNQQPLDNENRVRVRGMQALQGQYIVVASGDGVDTTNTELEGPSPVTSSTVARQAVPLAEAVGLACLTLAMLATR